MGNTNRAPATSFELFQIPPVVAVRHLDVNGTLKEAGRAADRRSRYGSSVLISAEVALAFVLLIGTGLLMRTFVNVLHAYPGFRAENVFSFRISGSSYAMLRQLQQNLAVLPGVRSAAVPHLPLSDTGNWYDNYWKEGASVESQNTAMADLRSILPGYFSTIGANLLSGRDFTQFDDVEHEHVAIMARRSARS